MLRKLICVSIFVFACLYAAQAEASVTIFLDEFNTISGWSTQGNVSADDQSSPAPSGDDVAKLKSYNEATSSMWRTISTAGYNNIGLSLYRKTKSSGDDNNDLFTIAWKKTGETAWNILETLDYNSSWQFKNWVLPSAASNSSVDVKFSLYNGDDGCHSSKDYAYIDDFKLTGDHTNGGDVIPEPVTTLLFGSGLIFAGYLRRKKTIV